MILHKDRRLCDTNEVANFDLQLHIQIESRRIDHKTSPNIIKRPNISKQLLTIVYEET